MAQLKATVNQKETKIEALQKQIRNLTDEKALIEKAKDKQFNDLQTTIHQKNRKMKKCRGKLKGQK